MPNYMRTKCLAIPAVLFVLAIGVLTGSIRSADAATPSPGRPRDSFLVSQNLFPLRVGVDIKAEKRDVKFDDGYVGELRARHYTGYLGYDVTSWATLFATIGTTETEWNENDSYSDAGLAMSAGFHLALWHINISQPEFITGRLSLALAGEYAHKQSGAATAKARWSEYFGALYAGYELYVNDPPERGDMPYGMMLFVAPCVSRLDGKRTGDGLPDMDFDEQDMFGVLGGIEVYIAYNLSVAGQVQYIGQPGFTGSLRYQF